MSIKSLCIGYLIAALGGFLVLATGRDADADIVTYAYRSQDFTSVPRSYTTSDMVTGTIAFATNARTRLRSTPLKPWPHLFLSISQLSQPLRESSDGRAALSG
jgi:hypothetical protein